MTAANKTETKSTAKAAADANHNAAKPAAVNEDALKTAEAFADATREQFESAMKNITEASEEWRKHADALGAELRERFEQNQKRVADVNAELVDAAQAEAAEAVQFATDLARAKTFADAAELHRGYWTKLFETRIERARTLTGTTVDVARDAMTPSKTDFGTIFDGKAFEAFFRFPVKA